MNVETDSERAAQGFRGESFEIWVDEQPMKAYPGETLASVLLTNGIRSFHDPQEGTYHSVHCGIGSCFSCRVAVDNQLNVRACVTIAVPGMRVHTCNQVKGS